MKIVYVLEVINKEAEWVLDSLFETREKAKKYAEDKFDIGSYYISEFEVY